MLMLMEVNVTNLCGQLRTDVVAILPIKFELYPTFSYLPFTFSKQSTKLLFTACGLPMDGQDVPIIPAIYTRMLFNWPYVVYHTVRYTDSSHPCGVFAHVFND